MESSMGSAIRFFGANKDSAACALCRYRCDHLERMDGASLLEKSGRSEWLCSDMEMVSDHDLTAM